MSTGSRAVKRLARVEDQVRGITRMLEDDRDCKDVLVEIRAARAALQAVATSLADARVTELIASILGAENADTLKLVDAVKVLKHGA